MADVETTALTQSSATLTKPETGGSQDTWGAKLNTNLDEIVTECNLISTALAATVVVANAALPKAGGTMTGNVHVLTATNVRAAAGNSGTCTMNLALADYFTSAPSGTCTYAFSNVPSTANAVVIWLLRVTNGVSQTLNWPAAVAWAGGTAPTFSANKDTVLFISEDGGTSVRGSMIQRNVA